MSQEQGRRRFVTCGLQGSSWKNPRNVDALGIASTQYGKHEVIVQKRKLSMGLLDLTNSNTPLQLVIHAAPRGSIAGLVTCSCEQL